MLARIHKRRRAGRFDRFGRVRCWLPPGARGSVWLPHAVFAARLPIGVRAVAAPDGESRGKLVSTLPRWQRNDRDALPKAVETPRYVGRKRV